MTARTRWALNLTTRAEVRAQGIDGSVGEPPHPSFFMTDGTSDRFGMLSIALQLVQGATEGPPGGLGLVFLAGDLPGLVDDDARGLGRRLPHPGVGG